VNRVRGEQRLTVGSVEYTLVPENGALANIEGRLDVGLLDLVARFLHQKARVTDCAVVLQECAKAGGKELPYQQAFDFALEDFATASKTATKLLLERWGATKDPAAGKEVAAASS
jgi:hypothetical protein